MSGTVERAFQLAPECQSLNELEKRLNAEGCEGVAMHLSSLSVRKQLRALMAGRDSPASKPALIGEAIHARAHDPESGT